MKNRRYNISLDVPWRSGTASLKTPEDILGSYWP